MATRAPVISKTVHANGVRLNVIEQGQGPAVLFCHGFPDIAQTWRSQMEAVAAAGYRAVALDMRGFGSSDAPSDPTLYSALHIVGDLIGVLDALEIGSAVLVGHDWGADHAQRAMLMRPDRFRALVSLSIPFAPRGEVSFHDDLRKRGLGERYYAFDMMKPDAAQRFAAADSTIPSILYWLSTDPPDGSGWDPVDPAKNMLRPSPAHRPDWADPDYVAQLIATFRTTGFEGGLNHYRGAQATFDLMAAFKHAVIRQPSLYIWGAADGLCNFFHPDPPTRAQLSQAQPGLVDVIRLENVGHWIQHEAADRLNAELIRFLGAIDRSGKDVNRRTPDGFTPLMIAAGLGHLETVRSLLTAGADVLAIKPRAGATALHKAALSGHPGVVQLLLDAGAFIDQQSPILGHTALMDAAIYKHEPVVAVLLERGARTAIRNHWHETALDIARRDGLDEIARLLEAKIEADHDAIRAQTLIPAIKQGDIGSVRALIAAGAAVDTSLPMVGSPDDDYTPLAVAAREGHADIVRLLLDAGADPRRSIGLYLGTALHEASYFGHADVIEVMTNTRDLAPQQHSRLDAQGAYNGMTPLHDAVWHGHDEAAKALVRAGHPLKLQTQAGLTARALATHYGYDDLAAFLAEAERANESAEPAQGGT